MKNKIFAVLLAGTLVCFGAGEVFAKAGKQLPFQLKQQGAPQKKAPQTLNIEVEEIIFQKTNQVRAKKSKKSLRKNPTLANLAKTHSQDMLTRNYLSHVNPEGKTVLNRIDPKTGRPKTHVGENIHYIESGGGLWDGEAISEWMISDWLRSRSHRKNLLSKQFTQIGLGCASNGKKIYCTQVFAGEGL